MNASAISLPHGHDGHSDGHGHHGPTLQYQPGLPLSRGKLIMWLFLSTEIMFFAALLGSYVVLRFGAPVWPKPHHVHLSEPIGALNTFVLICSSVTIVLSLEAARANKARLAKFWMLLTPVVYPARTEGLAGWLATWNPISPLITTARECLTAQPLTILPAFWIVTACAVIATFLGLVLYRLAMPHLIVRMGG